ncbi:U3 small nucleolar RNA-associated protein 6-domain-containing protein [Triangularia verruculosa]|uniref:U3 small nucleolar RNA-associated protein 6-domain-containing protein n=1 Tax=Triangularia verruculosa TaxID=2587418 RepID=A0AAN6X8N9_9PEZI|nr:U3 small nucleolar RNA-associated protein 6-domain-containing protein [Triangularia verruculosa]
MGGAAEKARFYLERAAPELREFEEKEIFTKDEIRSLVTKRSDFEHLVLSPGTKPTDFLNYISWETSLDRLRAKRCARLKIRSSSSHASQARTFNIFERAVNKHPGSLELWFAYLDFAANVKATKRWNRIATRALRLHPSEPSLWTLAGRRAAKAGDMERARAHFLRGCRFCTTEPNLWVEYARCEMEWLQKIEAKKAGKGVRKGVNPVEAIKDTETLQEGDMIEFDDEDSDEEMDGEMMLPDPDAEGADGKKKKKVMTEEETRKIEQSPALSGAIPMAIFDIARKQQFFGARAAEMFFDMFAHFGGLSCQERIVGHVLGAMQEMYPGHACTVSCWIRQPVVGVDVLGVGFPKALREVLARLKQGLGETKDKKALVKKITTWIEGVLVVEGLDEGIKMVLQHTKGSLEQQVAN